MAEFDVDAMLERFKERADIVKERPFPPVEGEARKRFIAQAEMDFTDFMLIATADWAVEDGKLVLRVPLAG